jgi:hypothetical protein
MRLDGLLNAVGVLTMKHAPLRRRDFLTSSLTGAGSFLCVGLMAEDAVAARKRRPIRARRIPKKMKKWDHAVIAGQMGTTFRFTAENGDQLDAELIETKGFPLTSRLHEKKAARKPFSALFRETAGTPLPQGTYLAKHDRLGSFSLFIVPVLPDPGYYEAIFS